MTETDPATSGTRRYGIADIGSNATRLLIVEVRSDGEHSVVESHREPVRMGRDVLPDAGSGSAGYLPI